MRANFDRDEFFPVRSYIVGNKRIAAFQGIERIASTSEGHAEDMALLKRAERITDAIFADRAGGISYVDREGTLDSGYLVSLAGYETCISQIDGEYGSVYAAVVDKLERIKEIGWGNRPIGVGWWTPDGIAGSTFIDVTINVADRDEALAYAERADQIAIYDVANKCDIDIRYA